MPTVTRVFEFDAAHRVMNEKVKCFNLHGHRFKVEVTFTYIGKSGLGYAIDFKEIKRIVGDWIDDNLDHACILNPEDSQLIMLCRSYEWRLYIMGMGNFGDVNPSAENIAHELFCVIKHLFNGAKFGVTIDRLRLYETPNCWVEVNSDEHDYMPTEKFINTLSHWRESKGDFNYDIREE